MTSADEELQAKLKALRDAYKVSLDVRLDEIDATLDRPLAADGGNAEDLNILPALAHKLTGSAGTFGLQAVNDIAGELEALCESLVKEEKDASAEVDRITELASNLRKAAEKESE